MCAIKKLSIISWLILSILFSTAAAPYSAANQAAGATPKITVTQLDVSQFPKVTVYISVTDTNGEPVSIDPSHLVIKEDNQVITPEAVTGKGEGGPLTTMLVMDVSGSMLVDKKLVIAKSVAKDYVNQMRTNDQAGLISFASNIQLVQPVTTDKNAINAKIDGLYATGDTTMYDALMKAVDVLNPLTGRKAIIALTDGMDNLSKNKPDEVIKAIGAKGLSISTIGFGVPNQGNGNVTALDEKTLTNLATRAGGSYGFAKDQASLQKIYERYDRALKSEYVISYTSPSTLRDGVGRSLNVSLNGSSPSSGAAAIQTSYNPGGLVPETGGQAPWTMFFLMLAGLIVILFIPSGVNLIRGALPQNGKIKLLGATPQKGRIKLK